MLTEVFNKLKDTILSQQRTEDSNRKKDDEYQQNTTSSIDRSAPHYGMLDDVIYRFDINTMDFLGFCNDDSGVDLYVFPIKMSAELLPYLDIINGLLWDLNQKQSNLPLNKLQLSDLNFTRTQEDVNDFCMLEHHPFTKTGRRAKYPYSLRLALRVIKFNVYNEHTIESEFYHHPIDIFFNKNGEIEKGRIVYPYGGNFYQYRIKLIDGKLKIAAVTVTDMMGNKTTINNSI